MIETFALIYLVMMCFTYFEMILLIKTTLERLKNDMLIIEQLHVKHRHLGSSKEDVDADLKKLMKDEFRRAVPIAVSVSLFFSIFVLPTMLLDSESFSKGFTKTYSTSARKRLIEKLS